MALDDLKPLSPAGTAPLSGPVQVPLSGPVPVPLSGSVQVPLSGPVPVPLSGPARRHALAEAVLRSSNEAKTSDEKQVIILGDKTSDQIPDLLLT
jgi:hypothetical protein